VAKSVGIFEASGAIIGADRRVRHQAVSIVTSEELRWMEFTFRATYSLFGESTTLPANFGAGFLGAGFGDTTTTPPTGDPVSNPTGPDWLAVIRTEQQVLPRSVAGAINGYELAIVLQFSGRVSCPRASGAARSIWVVSTPLDAPPQGGGDWTVNATSRYGSHSF
jgi:hypothetical protein